MFRDFALGLRILILFLAVPFWMTDPVLAQADTVQKEEKSDSQTLKTVVVKAVKPEEKGPFLPDVQGTRINLGKKTSLIDPEAVHTSTNNNYRHALAKTPGLLLSEETTPLFSLGYRGLAPDRAQFMQMMKDGIPIQADMFGYPEAYYTPALQTVDHIEFIHGGAGLMYGPQPGGALNFVTQKPVTDRILLTQSENAFGSDGYFSTYDAATGTVGPLGYHAYYHQRRGDGFRDGNSDFEAIASGAKVTVNQTGDSRLTGFFDQYYEEHGEPGGLSLTTTANPTYDQRREFTTRPHDRFIMERYYGGLIFEKEFSEKTQFDFRTYGGHYRRFSRRQNGGGFGTLATGATNAIQEQDFYNLGFEPRFRHDYELFGETHTVTVGTHTFFSHSPIVNQTGARPTADSGATTLYADRDMRYLSLFLENLFRFGKLSVTPGVRLEHFWQRIEEKINTAKTAAGQSLSDGKNFDFVPLFGLGIVYEIANGIEAYTNISESYRPQTFAQAVSTAANQTVAGDLKEGFAWQYDFGLRGKPFPFVTWDVDYFILHFFDQIGTLGDVTDNVGNSFTQGMEFFGEVDLVGAYDHFQNSNLAEPYGSVAPFFTLTLLDAEFTKGPSEGRQPQFAPQYNMRFGGAYRWRDRVKINATSAFVDDHFADDAGTLNRIVPSYQVWDVTGEVTLLKNVFGALGLSLFGGVNNIFDENYYARITSTGIDPAYPRNFFAGVKVDLGTPRER